MKKILLILLSVLLLPSVKIGKAQEDLPYYRVIDDITPFFSDQSATETIFYLPYTYYVKVLGVYGDLAHIECYGLGQTVKIDGFTYIDKLFKDGLSVTSPYLELTIKANKTAVLYKDKNLTTPIQFIFSERELNYYGKQTTPSGECVFFVGYIDQIGYVKEVDVYPFTIENHPNKLTFLPSQSDDIKGQSTTKNRTQTFRIIIISCLLLAGIVALMVSFKKNKSPEISGDCYEESDYE